MIDYWNNKVKRRNNKESLVKIDYLLGAVGSPATARTRVEPCSATGVKDTMDRVTGAN